uniref:Uncharacterized protein n=1 Tax=Vitis vinifera TaxID=29760 RepID=A5BBU3_VITVI|nr:hypothetical protein VITISV_030424 [Vitis vinifera]
MSVENIGKLQENTAALCKIRRIRTCLTGQNSGSEISAHRKGDRLRVQGVGTPPPDDTERALLSGTTPSGFPQGTCDAMLFEATPSEFPKRTRAAMLSGLPQGEAHDTREHHTPDDSISYPDMLSGWKTLTKVSKPCYVIPTACHRPCSAALQWCVRTPCPDIFCHGFQRTLLNLGLLW